ncbi:MAG: DUF4062 domain-containing protein, partial [Acidobacteriota bacterium]|nr:DUF4062 domain-containing protein [Acidobacteriota bacterium]
MAERLTVMISSTILDLTEHRQAAKDACIEQCMLPLMMEYTPPVDKNVIQMSLGLVDQCEIYLCIVGGRYGDVPPGYDKSVTQMEYERAVEKGKVRLIFIMGKDHTPKIRYRHRQLHRAQFEEFKKRLMAERFIGYFNSVDDLHIKIVNSLAEVRRTWAAARRRPKPDPGQEKPRPREPLLIVHPYTLQESKEFVGREADLESLNRWVSDPSAPRYKDHIYNIFAVGGEGKSALAWKWFNDLAAEKMAPLAGRFWWSFEDDADIKNFITRAHSYVTGCSVRQTQGLPDYEREEKLLNVLRGEPFLFVLDGLESLMVSHVDEDGGHARDTGGGVPAGGAPPGAPHYSAADYPHRQTIDPAAGKFLRKLSSILKEDRSARILMTTRELPAALETGTG